jgi:hypothetical protein
MSPMSDDCWSITRNGEEFKPRNPSNRGSRAGRTIITMKILRSIALATTLASCAHPMTFPAPYNQGPVQITVNDFSGDGNGNITGVSGTATNVSGKYLKVCTITFNVIDSSGTKISEAIASTLGLDSGQSWKFQAGFDSPFSLDSTHLTPGQTNCPA